MKAQSSCYKVVRGLNSSQCRKKSGKP